MNGYLDAASGATVVSVTGIPFDSYSVIIYFNGDSPSQDRVYNYQIGSSSIFVQDNSPFSGTFIETVGSTSDLGTSTPAGNFVVFTGLTGSAFTLDSIPGTSLVTQRSVINAIQIQATPEPSSFALALLGIAALGFRLRRIRN